MNTLPVDSQPVPASDESLASLQTGQQECLVSGHHQEGRCTSEQNSEAI
jgi:hypothetical protein